MFEAVGIKKAIRFVWYQWFCFFIHISLPPVRVILLRLAGATIGSDVVLLDVSFVNLYHYGFSKVKIGNRCFVGDGVEFDTRGGVTLADDVTISNRVTVVTHINVGYKSHPLQKYFPTREQIVTLEKGCYIGTGAILLPGVVIGQEAVVGAGSVVTKRVTDRTVVAGIPAKKIRNIYGRSSA